MDVKHNIGWRNIMSCGSVIMPVDVDGGRCAAFILKPARGSAVFVCSRCLCAALKLLVEVHLSGLMSPVHEESLRKR